MNANITGNMTADMTDMMIRHDALDDAVLRRMILAGEIRYGGNHRLGIYGRLDCASGKRMKRSTRVFFADEDAARAAGFRPCGHCMPDAYRMWRRAASGIRA
jgi:methylphosphotriester-DNA--protein-cysteine methyltransferase